MSRNLAFLALLFISIVSFAQYEDFDLSKYKLPDIKRHQLDFEFMSGGNSQHSNSVYYHSLGTEFYERKNHEFSANVELEYSYFGNSEKFQSTLKTKVKSNYSMHNESVNDEDLYDDSDFTNYLSFHYDFKFFPGKKNWFVELIPNANFRFSNLNQNIKEIKNKAKSVNSGLGIGGGKGRIEQVQDFRHAILLLQEIEKRGVANETLTDSEVYEFSQLISKLKNKRVFDARKRKEADLIALDSFLVDKGVVDKNSGIYYFVGLEDIWQFGDLQIRESGRQVKVIATPRYRLNEDDYGDDKYRLEVFNVSGVINYAVYNPVSIKWQTNYNFGLAYIYSDKLVEDGISTSSSKYISQFYSDANVGFFPDTRTSVFLRGNISIGNNSEEGLIDDEKFAFHYQFGVYAYYYISERLRLGGSTNYYSNLSGIFNEDIENSTSHYFRYNLNFNYAIF